MLELHELLKEVINLFANEKAQPNNKNIIQKHSGGKETLGVFECLLDGKKVAVKIYKPIITHLIVHTIASTYLMNNIDYFNSALIDQNIKLTFPKSIALGYSTSNSLLSQVAILVQEWVENGEEIHKSFPLDHINIIRSLVRVLTTEKGLMVDIMSKNWLKTEDNYVTYIDLILFNPKGPILEKIKKWALELDFRY